jgi:cell division protein FtsI (penicillin-binding protein 3)
MAMTTTVGTKPIALTSPTIAQGETAQKSPGGGTVVLEVEEGGIQVPSFLGKNLRTAIETAQDAGLDLDAVGSGVAREQSPQAGTRVAAGAHIMVHFGR